MATAPTDLLNPNTPKKKPLTQGASGAGIMQGDDQLGLGPDKMGIGVPAPVQGPPLQQTSDLEAQNLPTPPPAQPPAQGTPQAPTHQPPEAPSQQPDAPLPPQPPATTPSPTPTPQQPVTAQQGIDLLNQDMMARFNRPLTQQEINGLAQALGAPQGPNGTYTPQQLQTARDWVAQYSGDINNPFGAAPQTPAAPPGAPPPGLPTIGPNTPTPQTPVTVQQGLQILNADAALRFGRVLNQAEINGLSQLIGPPQGPNGTYTPQQLQAARDWVARYSGDIKNPWGPLPETAPGSTTNLANTRLGELLGLSYGEVDPNSKAITQPLGAFRSAQSRATDRARMAMALRNQAQGISGGGAESGLLGLLEEQGQNEASFEANLYAQELATQRKQLTEAIQLATQAGLQNKARELQEKLGTLDIELRKLLGQGQLALGAKQLDLQDKQFLESLGFNYANLSASLNNQAINNIVNQL